VANSERHLVTVTKMTSDVHYLPQFSLHNFYSEENLWGLGDVGPLYMTDVLSLQALVHDLFYYKGGLRACPQKNCTSEIEYKIVILVVYHKNYQLKTSLIAVLE